MTILGKHLGSTLATVLAACSLTALPARAADSYDDARVLKIAVTAQNPGDQSGPTSFYASAKLTATCSYGYVKTGLISNYAVPWTSVQFFYRKPGSGALVVFGSVKTCLAPNCTSTYGLPALPPPGITVGCKLVRLQDGAELPDAIVTNNKAETFVTIQSKPATIGAMRSGGAWSKAAPGAVSGLGSALSGHVKQCQTALSASVNVDAQQLAGPLFGPAELAQTKIMLHLQGSEAAGNYVNCHYATSGKDVPNLVVVLKCANAAPRTGQPHSFSCTP